MNRLSGLQSRHRWRSLVGLLLILSFCAVACSCSGGSSVSTAASVTSSSSVATAPSTTSPAPPTTDVTTTSTSEAPAPATTSTSVAEDGSRTVWFTRLADLQAATTLPIIGSVPGDVSEIEFRKDGTLEYYRFRANYEGQRFVVTLGPSNLFNDEGGEEPDYSHTVDISSTVKTPDGWDTRVIIYSEDAPRDLLEAFAAALDIPGRVE